MFFSRPPSGNCETENVGLYSETSLASTHEWDLCGLSAGKKVVIKGVQRSYYSTY